MHFCKLLELDYVKRNDDEDFYCRESPYLKYVLQSILVDTNNSKLKDSHMIGRYRPIKPSDSMIKMLRSIVTALQNARICDNPEYGELITFYANEPCPLVCARCGRDIQWESQPMSVGSCPVCSTEYNINTYNCSLHSPPVLLIEKDKK
jgi:hypothetical protein